MASDEIHLEDRDKLVEMILSKLGADASRPFVLVINTTVRPKVVRAIGARPPAKEEKKPKNTIAGPSPDYRSFVSGDTRHNFSPRRLAV